MNAKWETVRSLKRRAEHHRKDKLIVFNCSDLFLNLDS